MKRIRWTMVATVLCVGLSAGALVAAAGFEASITFDHVPGTKGAATFGHAAHADGYKKADGTAITCRTCHHTVKTDRPSPAEVKACGTCHVAEGKPQVVVGGKKAPFIAVKNVDKDQYDKKSPLLHKTCLTCHQKVRKNSKGESITGCKKCHK